MTAKEILERLREEEPETLLADGFEAAFAGTVQVFGKPTLALYDREKCIEILMVRDGMTFDQAVEFFDFNVAGAFMGEHTPAFAVLAKPEKPGEVRGSAKAQAGITTRIIRKEKP